MNQHKSTFFEGQVIDDRTEISIIQLCRVCAVEQTVVERLVDEGIIEPIRHEDETLYFAPSCLKRTRVVMSLRSDLGVNMAGAALALELLDRIDKLQSKLHLAVGESPD